MNVEKREQVLHGIGSRLRWLRKEKNNSLCVCNYSLYCSPTYYAKREAGKLPLNALDLLALLTLYPGLCLVWLLTGKGEAFPHVG